MKKCKICKKYINEFEGHSEHYATLKDLSKKPKFCLCMDCTEKLNKITKLRNKLFGKNKQLVIIIKNEK